MKKLLLTSLATLLSTGIVYAGTPCNQFEIRINNQLDENLLATTIDMKGADLQPGVIQKIDSKKTQVFTVNASKDDAPMNGEFVFHTISLPSKVVKIQFDMNNAGLVCEYNDKSPTSDLALSKAQATGKMDYTISYN